MSVPPVRTKLAGFVLAGAIAGMAGGLYAVLLGAVAFNTFDPSYGLVVFSMAVIGGLGSISGVLMGVGLIEVLSYSFPKYQLVFTGVGLLLVLFFLPGGLAEGVQSIRDRLLKIVAVAAPDPGAQPRRRPPGGAGRPRPGGVVHPGAHAQRGERNGRGRLRRRDLHVEKKKMIKRRPVAGARARHPRRGHGAGPGARAPRAARTG